MGDTNRVKLGYIEESTWGTTPSGALQVMRMAGESLKQEQSNQNSNEIRDDRQITDVIRVSARGTGGINIEMSYGAHDDLLSAAIGSAGFSTELSESITATVTAGSGSYVIVRGSGDWVADGFVVNEWVRMGGGLAAANAGYGKVSAVTATDLTITMNGNGTTEGPVAAVVQGGGNGVNGTDLRYFSFERAYGDLSNEFAALRGMAPNQTSLNIQAENILTGSFDLMGKEETTESSTIGTGYTAAPTNDVMAATADVYQVQRSGETFDIIAATFDINQNIRARPQVGSLTPIGLSLGTFEVSGTFRAYYNDSTLIDRFLANNSDSVVIVMEDQAGNAYLFEAPEIRWTAGQRVAGSQNADVEAEMSWTAKMDPTEQITFRIQRFAAA